MIHVSYEGTAPRKGRDDDAAYDLKALYGGSIAPGGRALVRTGLMIAIPSGYVGMVCSRSGLTLKSGVIVANAPGIIDPNYRGDIGVILLNTSDKEYVFNAGDRIAQLMFVKTASAYWQMSKMDELLTDRGADGFGSSGV